MTLQPWNRRTLALAFAIVGGGVSLTPQELPPGAGAQLVQTRCLACHGADLIVSQRLSSRGWEAEVAKMIRWGAGISDLERPALVEYLAANFAPRPLASHQPEVAGARVYERACRLCHGDDLVEQQRLSLAGWGREVDKMVGWGASVPAGDKTALVAYLFARWGR